jgi:hypothetical protein
MNEKTIKEILLGLIIISIMIGGYWAGNLDGYRQGQRDAVKGIQYYQYQTNSISTTNIVRIP